MTNSNRKINVASHVFNANDLSRNILDHFTLVELYKAAGTSKAFFSYLHDPLSLQLRQKIESFLGIDLKSLGIEINNDNLDARTIWRSPVVWEAFYIIMTHKNTPLIQKQDAIAIIIALKNADAITKFIRLSILYKDELTACKLLNGLSPYSDINKTINSVKKAENYCQAHDETILTAALRQTHLKLLEALLKRSDVDPNARNTLGQTPLDIVIKRNHHHLLTESNIIFKQKISIPVYKKIQMISALLKNTKIDVNLESSEYAESAEFLRSIKNVDCSPIKYYLWKLGFNSDSYCDDFYSCLIVDLLVKKGANLNLKLKDIGGGELAKAKEHVAEWQNLKAKLDTIVQKAAKF